MKPRLLVRWTSLRWVQDRKDYWELKLDDCLASVSRRHDGTCGVWVEFRLKDFNVQVCAKHDYKSRDAAMAAAERIIMNGIPNERVGS